MKHEEIGSMWKAYWGRKSHRKPAHSLTDLCQELNINPKFLNGKLSRLDAPKPRFYCHTRGKNRPYYDQNIFKAWWKTVSEEQK